MCLVIPGMTRNPSRNTELGINLWIPAFAGMTERIYNDFVRQYFVYILASGKNGTLYVGVTGNLENRMNVHQSSVIKGFTQRYKVYNLVYYEIHNSAAEAIKREKQIKKWKRWWKIDLIESINPEWKEMDY